MVQWTVNTFTIALLSYKNEEADQFNCSNGSLIALAQIILLTSHLQITICLSTITLYSNHAKHWTFRFGSIGSHGQTRCWFDQKIIRHNAHKRYSQIMSKNHLLVVKKYQRSWFLRIHNLLWRIVYSTAFTPINVPRSTQNFKNILWLNPAKSINLEY